MTNSTGERIVGKHLSNETLMGSILGKLISILAEISLLVDCN